MGYIQNYFGKILLSLLVLGCVNVVEAQVVVGEATYYADKFQGRQTASGETFDQSKLTAAHKTLPFGTYVQVTNLSNGRSVEVRINDRMPKSNPRLIDLSRAAATQIDMIRAGRAQVRMVVLGEGGGSLPPNNSGTQEGLEPIDISDLPVTDQNGFEVPADQGNGGSTGSNTGGSAGNISAEEANRYTPALFFMGASKTFPEGYGVQVAAFNSFYRLLEGLDEIYAKGENRTLVHSGMKDGKPIFRILIGPFETKADADKVRKELKKQRIDGWVVSLAQLGG